MVGESWGQQHSSGLLTLLIARVDRMLAPTAQPLAASPILPHTCSTYPIPCTLSPTVQRGGICAVLHCPADQRAGRDAHAAGQPGQRTGGQRPQHDQGGCTRGGQRDGWDVGLHPCQLMFRPDAVCLTCLCPQTVSYLHDTALVLPTGAGALPRGVCQQASAGRRRRCQQHIGCTGSRSRGGDSSSSSKGRPGTHGTRSGVPSGGQRLPATRRCCPGNFTRQAGHIQCLTTIEWKGAWRFVSLHALMEHACVPSELYIHSALMPAALLSLLYFICLTTAQ